MVGVQSFQQGNRQLSAAVSSFFNNVTSQLSGAVPSPIAGPCGGMDAATEPPGMGLRRVPQAVRAPRTRLTRLLT